jgi:hypothetical protein
MASIALLFYVIQVARLIARNFYRFYSEEYLENYLGPTTHSERIQATYLSLKLAGKYA